MRKKAAKSRKEARKNPLWKSKIPKDIGVPNAFPFKEQILEEIENERQEQQERRDAMNEAKAAAKEERKLQWEAAENGEVVERKESDEWDIDELGSDVEIIEDEVEDDEFEGLSDEEATTAEVSDKQVQSVIFKSDIIVMVLDARDPQTCRVSWLEERLQTPEYTTKHLIIFRTKTDHIPPGILLRWHDYLKASTSAPIIDSIDELSAALKHHARSRRMKWTTVGVLGLPNVGKSSVVNALAKAHNHRHPVCTVSNEMGTTKAVREVVLDTSMRVLDSPAIQPLSTDATSTNLYLLNALPISSMKQDARRVAETMFHRLHADTDMWTRFSASHRLTPLLAKYSYQGTELIEEFATDFFLQMARNTNRVMRKGTVNIQAVAVDFIRSWRHGNIDWWMPV